MLPDAPISFMPTGRIGTPKAITAETYTYHAGGTEHQGLTIGWTAPDDARVDQFVLDIKGPDDIAFGTAYFGDVPDLPAGWTSGSKEGETEEEAGVVNLGSLHHLNFQINIQHSHSASCFYWCQY